jgi:hypothetical protein
MFFLRNGGHYERSISAKWKKNIYNYRVQWKNISIMLPFLNGEEMPKEGAILISRRKV